MLWTICFGLSLACLLLSLAIGAVKWRHYRSARLLTPFFFLLAGVALAVAVGLLPVINAHLEGTRIRGWKLIMLDVLQTIRVFTFNVEADALLECVHTAAADIRDVYSAYLAFLMVIAPVMTLGALTALFRSAMSSLSNGLHFRRDVFAFSALNEKSLMLAKDLRRLHPRAGLVFADVSREERDSDSDAVGAARELKALLFQQDITAVGFSHHSRQATITFFAIGEDDSENLLLSLKLLERYRERDNTGLYVFSGSAEGELLLSGVDRGKVKLRRVNEVRSLVYRFLDDEGARLFHTAQDCGGGDRRITAVIVGLGKYGSELLKALSWFCQMDGYAVQLHAFDADPLAEDRFAACCPELLSPLLNGADIPGECRYTIAIHSGVDAYTETFVKQMAELEAPTFVFVCLGDDEKNIDRAAFLRMVCERNGCKPVIKTVVYSEREHEALAGLKNYRGQAYEIEAMGDLAGTCSAAVLMDSALEQRALQRHLKWGREEEFWRYEYNYRSSMASAVHLKARIACGIPGADRSEDELTREERDGIERLEHRRWNAYMRSEGYVFSGSREKQSRNDLAKQHHDLVPFDVLPEEEKRKDSAVGTS